MPLHIYGVRPGIRELPGLDEAESDGSSYEGPYVLILYNDDYHSIDEVVMQLQKATGYGIDRCVEITYEAHSRGRAIAFTGSQAECERVAQVLRQIRLQVETDRQ